MIDLAKFSSLIGRIYDCAMDQDRWPPVLQEICDGMDAVGGSIHVVDPISATQQVLVEYGVDPEWSARGRETYATMSPIGAAVLMAELEQPVSAFDFVDEDEYLESRFYREWLAPKGYMDMMGALIVKKRSEIGAISAIRLRDKGRFTEQNREIVGLIAPHVRRAVAISGFLEHRRTDAETLASFVDSLSACVIFLDRSGRMLRANPAADALLDAGEIARVRNGQLTLVDRHADRLIRARLTAEGNEVLLLSVRRGAEAIGVALMPFKAGLFALFMKAEAPDAPAIGKMLAHSYGLTAREVAVLMPMIEGRTLQEIADTLGIGAATVRTHLNRIFAKTGTNRQAELVALILKSLQLV